MPFPVLHPKVDCAGPAYSWVSDERNPAAAGDVLVDTGALVAGDYEIVGSCGIVSVNSLDWEIQRRDAANAVSLWVVPGMIFCDVRQMHVARVTVAANERFRIVTVVGLAALVKTSLQWRRVG